MPGNIGAKILKVNNQETALLMSEKDSIELDERFISAARHQSEGSLDKAEKLFSLLLAESPDEFKLLQRFGMVLAQLGRASEAIPHLERAIRLRPDNAGAYYYLGIAHEHLGDTDSAIDNYHCTLAYQKNFRPAHLAIANINLPFEHYTEVLKRFHQWLRPRNYVEIGVETGKSMVLAEPPTVCIGVEPQPKINVTFSAPTRIFEKTSDEFFANEDLCKEIGGETVDLSFIDGLHLFEAVLKDFINIERYSSRKTVVLLHDCIPLNEATSARERSTTFWSGDTWKVIPCLKRYRPDLAIITIAAPPTGLAVITRLDPESTILSENLDEINKQFIPLEYAFLDSGKHDILNVMIDDWPSIQKRISESWE